MRTRPMFLALAILFVAGAFVLASVATGKSRKITSWTPPRLKAIVQDPPGTISGEVDRDLIPDAAAYAILFRFVAHNHNNNAVVSSYLKHNGFEDSDIATIKAIGADFGHRVAVLDRQVQSIKDKNWPNPSSSVMGQLDQLQQQKEALVNELANSFAARLNSQGQEKINSLIRDRIKRKMKIFPPPTAPGGQGWKPKHH